MRIIRLCLVVDVEDVDGQRKTVEDAFPNLDDLNALPGVRRLEMSVTVGVADDGV